jgi:ATP-dependent protease ClpP protease subunit
MPLPKPKRDERKDDFIERCMADENIRRDFDDEEQRRAVCETQWERGEMAQIQLDGIVGLDVLASDVRDQLNEANGEPVELLVNSAGGVVYEGLAIYNAIRDYARAGNEVTARVVGLAASMSTYIPLAANRVTVEDNAVWMIHNPRVLAIGDQNDLQKAARTLEGLANVLANAYARKSGQEKDQIRSQMDEETWMFGQEIVDAGFADDIEAAGDGEEDKESAVAVARTQFEHMKDRIQKEQAEDVDQAAAMLNIEASQRSAVSRSETDSRHEQAGDKQREVPMDAEQIKKEHPAAYEEIIKAGVQQERARVAELQGQKQYDPQNAQLERVVEQAIADGSTLMQMQTAINVAIRDGGKLDGENPPEVNASHEEQETLSAEEKAICANLGISEEEYLAQKRKEGNE